MLHHLLPQQIIKEFLGFNGTPILPTRPAVVLSSQESASLHAVILVGREQKGVWKQLGKLLWPKFAKAYIECVLAPNVPHSEEGFRAFEKLSHDAQEMERGLVREGWEFLRVPPFHFA